MFQKISLSRICVFFVVAMMLNYSIAASENAPVKPISVQLDQIKNGDISIALTTLEGLVALGPPYDGLAIQAGLTSKDIRVCGYSLEKWLSAGNPIFPEIEDTVKLRLDPKILSRIEGWFLKKQGKDLEQNGVLTLIFTRGGSDIPFYGTLSQCGIKVSSNNMIISLNVLINDGLPFLVGDYTLNRRDGPNDVIPVSFFLQ